MGKRTLLALIFTIFVISGTRSEEKPFLDLSCHPEYDPVGRSPLTGGQFVQSTMEKCKKQTLPGWCYEVCVLSLHQILLFGGDELATESFMANGINALLKNYDIEFSMNIASKIVDECSGTVAEVRHLPCEEKTKLYDCIRNAVSCGAHCDETCQSRPSSIFDIFVFEI